MAVDLINAEDSIKETEDVASIGAKDLVGISLPSRLKKALDVAADNANMKFSAYCRAALADKVGMVLTEAESGRARKYENDAERKEATAKKAKGEYDLLVALKAAMAAGAIDVEAIMKFARPTKPRVSHKVLEVSETETVQ